MIDIVAKPPIIGRQYSVREIDGVYIVRIIESTQSRVVYELGDGSRQKVPVGYFLYALTPVLVAQA